MPGIPTIAELIAQLLKVKITPGERTKLVKWAYTGLVSWWRNKRRPFKAAIGAGILICGSWWILHLYAPATHRNDLSAGLPVSHPTLTLMDGREVLLDTLSDGRIIEDDGLVLQKAAPNTINYLSSQPRGGHHHSAKPLYHTFKMPYGESWHIQLPDGSKVQLKPGSELSTMVYPRAETSIRRAVILRGEAYFDIAADKRRSFSVTTTKGVVTVLGTTFDVVADERSDALRAILVLGAIKVDHNDRSVTLHPGQEARIDKTTNDTIVVRNTDTLLSLSWRGEQFDFRGKNLREMMHDLEEWYGLDPSYFEGAVDTVHLEALGGGHIAKANTVDELLKKIQFPESIQYRIDGNRVIISQKR